MPDSAPENALPNYENPPVVETVLGVQFHRLPGFRNAHLGAFWKTLDSDEWPVVLDVAPLPPQFERFEEGARWGRGVKLQLTQDPACRVQIKNKDGDRMIQVQNGRLHFNWIGETGGKYPRHEKVREGFLSVLAEFTAFVEQENVGEFRPNQWEVTYVNHVPQYSVWKSPSDWSFFKPLNGLPTLPNLVEGESFTGEWHFVIPEQRGRLHVQWNHGLRSGAEESEGEVLRLMFTARGPIDESDDQRDTILDGLKLGRQTIVSSFRQLMSEDANNYWGLKHVND